MPKQTIYERIKEAMNEAGMDSTSIAMAKLCKISPPSVNGWKHGKGPSRENLRLIAIATGFCVEWLETGRGPRYPGPPTDKTMAEIFQLVAAARHETQQQRHPALAFRHRSRYTGHLAAFQKHWI